MKYCAFVWLLGLSALFGIARADALSEASALFERYVALEHAFDPAVADLYADDALIVNTRLYPNGESVDLKVPATEYKMLIRQAMPVAKATNDTSEYSDVTYVEEGRGFRVHARRHSNLEQHTSPLTLLVEPDAQGRWVIREELSESLAVPPRPQAAQ
ncbi:MAG: hypothetical protein KDJ33_11645 [Gammaproteobacteria bacterium]|nr:hypothetical protein [Gammaproteobacteria bacterium]